MKRTHKVHVKLTTKSKARLKEFLLHSPRFKEIVRDDPNVQRAIKRRLRG